MCSTIHWFFSFGHTFLVWILNIFLEESEVFLRILKCLFVFKRSDFFIWRNPKARGKKVNICIHIELSYIFSGHQRPLIPWPDDVDYLAEWMIDHCSCYNDVHFLLKVLQIALQDHPDVIQAWRRGGDSEAQRVALEVIGPRIREIVGVVTVAVGGARKIRGAPRLKKAVMLAAESAGFEALKVAEISKTGELGRHEAELLALTAAANENAAEDFAYRNFLDTYRPYVAGPSGRWSMKMFFSFFRFVFANDFAKFKSCSQKRRKNIKRQNVRPCSKMWFLRVFFNFFPKRRRRFWHLWNVF